MLLLVVIFGIAVAIFMIFESFVNWRENPISTTVETFPISEMTFPNVTVCPPKSLFLNLNNDIQNSIKTKINKDLRYVILDYALEVIQEDFYKEAMMNLSKIQDPDRYYNWYYGYTSVEFPYWYRPYGNKPQIMYYMDTYATSGNISTNNFGEKFAADKVDDSRIKISVYIMVPRDYRGEKDTSLTIKIEKNTLPFDYMQVWPPGAVIDNSLTHWSRNFTLYDMKFAPFKSEFEMLFDRMEDDISISKLDLEWMPGFRLTWSYNRQMKPDTFLGNTTTTGLHGEFIR